MRSKRPSACLWRECLHLWTTPAQEPPQAAFQTPIRSPFFKCDQISGLSSLCRHVGHKNGSDYSVCVRVCRGEFFTGAQTHVTSTFCSQCLTGGRKGRVCTRKKRKRQREEGQGPSELTFEGEANPRRRVQAGAGANAQGQQEEPGSRCCHGNSHAGIPRRTKSGRGGKSRGMDYYYRAPHEKYET